MQYTKLQLEQKIETLNQDYHNAIGATNRKRVQTTLHYYIMHLAKFDDNPALKTITPK